MPFQVKDNNIIHMSYGCYTLNRMESLSLFHIKCKVNCPLIEAITNLNAFIQGGEKSNEKYVTKFRLTGFVVFYPSLLNELMCFCFLQD